MNNPHLILEVDLISEFDKIKGLVELFIKSKEKGKFYSLFRPILDDYLLNNNTTFEKVYEWLNNNYTKDLRFMFFIGYLNYAGVGTTRNFNMALCYFNKASSHPIAQYYLGICHEFGIGVEKD